VSISVQASPLFVRTKHGNVEGFESNGINKWLGVPYAKPPVGEHRFKRTEEHTGWQGVLETKKFGPKPFQFMGPDRKMKIEENEDCLTANIWAPKDARLCPVFVWIYGGANACGEGSDPAYDGASFARQGIVFVNFNYRVGPLGFYDFSVYDKSFDSNCGVSDQLAALRWVKENIAEFGGDPDQITIAGESAGGTGVYDMLAAPSAKGLFKRAIAQSGLPDSTEYPALMKRNTDLFLNKIGMKPEEVHKLRTIHPKELRQAAVWLIGKNCSFYPGIFAPGPVLDDLLPEKPWDALAKGSAEGVDVIFGTNHDEGSMFTVGKMFPNSWAQVEEMLKANGYEDRAPDFTRVYGSMRKKTAVTAIATDRAFWADYVRCADAQSAHGTVHAYRFDFIHTLLKLAGLGAMHGSEINHVLNTSGSLGGMITLLTSRKRISAIRRYMHTAWISFVRTGDPNGNLPMEWNQYDLERRTTFIFNDVCSVEENPHLDRFELWKDIALYGN
jgi:para-nitrobenzyl esterase